MLLKLCLLKAGFPGQMEKKSARGWALERNKKAPPASSLWLPGTGSKFLSSGWLCSQPSTPFQWSAWRQGSPRHHARARLQRQRDIRELSSKWLGCPRPRMCLLLLTDSILLVLIREREWGKDKFYILTHKSLPHPKSLVFSLLL